MVNKETWNILIITILVGFLLFIIFQISNLKKEDLEFIYNLIEKIGFK